MASFNSGEFKFTWKQPPGPDGDHQGQHRPSEHKSQVGFGELKSPAHCSFLHGASARPL